MHARAVTSAFAAAGALGCTVPRTPATLPDPPYIAVMSGQMPRPIDQVSRHGWIVVQPARGRSHRYEFGSSGGDDPFSDFAAGDVMLHGVIRGTPAEIATKDRCLADAESEYYRLHPDYFPIPGPNSNTFVAFLDRRCALGVELPATAIGRDYVGPVGAALTEGRTGVEIGSIPLGLRVGLREGAGIQLFGLPLGLHVWPPGIDLPVNPGRAGIDGDEHTDRPVERELPFPRKIPSTAVASVQMLTAGWVVVDPSRALDLAGEGTVALSARAIYGAPIGYAAGLELEAGFASPLGFAYGAHVFPLGVGAPITQTGYVALFWGVGASGVAARIPSGLDLPHELRVEFDLGPRARIALHARGTFVALEPLRRGGKLGFDETSFGVTARYGRAAGYDHGAFGSGYFFGFERRELVGSAMIGFLLGTEIDGGYSRERE